MRDSISHDPDLTAVSDLEINLKAYARRVGFSLVGIAPATDADRFDRFQAWIDAGSHGQMGYMAKNSEARRHPRSMLEAVRSVVMVGLDDTVPANEETRERWPPPPAPPSEGGEKIEAPACQGARKNLGKVARFAVGRDYHESIWQRLNDLQMWLQAEVPGCKTRGVADTAPLLERDFARRAGLGWIGKNTMLINKQRGSYVMLGAMLTDVELKPDLPHAAGHCGTCTRCLTACPTDAFPAPGVLDARKCISYLNIEVKGPLTTKQQEMVGDWLYGCDICQDVCPWNRKEVAPTMTADARQLVALSETEFRLQFRDTSVWRIHRRGLARNAAIVLGATGDGDALPALHSALNDPDDGVRQAAASAIQQIEQRTRDSR